MPIAGPDNWRLRPRCSDFPSSRRPPGGLGARRSAARLSNSLVPALLLSGCVMTGLLTAGPAVAGTYHAGGTAALQAAVASADSAPGASTIELSSGQFLPESTLTIKRDITIVGPATAPGATLGGGSVAPFPADLLRVEAHAKLTLRNVEVSAGGGEGTSAAIDDFGAVELEYAALVGNSGPALWVQPGATATVRDATLAENRATAIVNDGVVSVSNATIASNRGEGVENRGKLGLTNTIVASNGGSGDCEGHATTSDHSLDSDGSCGVGALSHSDPRLARLAGNGGPTQTQALEAGSPAIGAADAGKCPAEDQRHYTRPAGAVCDLGAYQSTAVAGAGAGGSGGQDGGTGSTGVGGAFTVSAHGALRGPAHSRITFTLRAQEHRAATTFTYRDRARSVSLRALVLGTLAVDRRRGIATLRGSALAGAGRGHRVRVTLVLVSHGRHRTLRIRLSSGYYESGSLLAGTVTFQRGGA